MVISCGWALDQDLHSPCYLRQSSAEPTPHMGASFAIVGGAVSWRAGRNAGDQAFLLENSIAAAKASGAPLIFPGTVYNFSPDAFPNLLMSRSPRTRKSGNNLSASQSVRCATCRVISSDVSAVSSYPM